MYGCNKLYCEQLGRYYNRYYKQLAPKASPGLVDFRAVRFPALVAMGLSDRGSGWNVEMQLKSIRLGLHVVEVPVSYRPPRRRPAKPRDMIDSVQASGRVLFQILRNATAR